ncbi:coiled-coil domain-containing protein 126 isoform X2 [Rhinatrema bivittatum]|uniref:coiled-coil domain-containing protein 126 isoform X2 n=1 Tax=Rhinatrema bivittatum TaxID=194408 RepID=UPI001128A404|nr:coiled-coil domain-containing protein 126 isoform X2 [Rhinatrema bivittatum]XP_029444955.1 coiled-coil domain-containing protein 126 isoform X2 [Rhinatrema bivittatum]XP_029444956.1 coiled-coil domain-containing protein 126 isoform X2 [Rhinatrema bivittatum]
MFSEHPRHESSAELRVQILDLSKRYVKALAEENKSAVNGGHGGSMAGYADLKRTIAVLLDDILQRLGKLENKVDDSVGNGLSTNVTNSTSGNLVPATATQLEPVLGFGTISLHSELPRDLLPHFNRPSFLSLVIAAPGLLQ